MSTPRPSGFAVSIPDKRIVAAIPSSGGRAKLAEVVAAKIESDIIAKGWIVGSVVGSEADLLEQYQVSRAVLREALRIVEHHFVATMRRGPGGGLVVTEPDVEAIVRAVALQLEYQGIEPRHLHEARTLLELTCVRLAVERITASEAEELREQMEVDRTRPGRAQNFHVWIAQLTGNPALALFVSVLGRLMRDYLIFDQSDRAETEELNSSHRAIAEALIEREGAKAEQLLLEHLEQVKSWIEPPRRVRRAKATRRKA